MGRGDLKFLACIGAFLGCVPSFSPSSPARLYGSIIGLMTLVGGPTRLVAQNYLFGPYSRSAQLLDVFRRLSRPLVPNVASTVAPLSAP